ncbi:MAG: sugar phosphate isomerase/epimerase family protein [Gemmataceae bacterium]
MNELLFGYNTNGFAHHRLEDALEIMADLGYESVALTLDQHALNPFVPEHSRQVLGFRRYVKLFSGMGVIETGARFLLDPYRKHQPTIVSASVREQRRRLDFLTRAIDTAEQTGFALVSFWSGAATDAAESRTIMRRVVAACKRLCDHAARRNVRLAFEPEPGMFIDTMAKFGELFDRVKHPAFGLTLDIGHLHCMGETPIEDHIRRWKDVLWNVHIEDMRRGVHEHLMFGEGEIGFPPVLRALREVGYAGGVHVELSRHSHDAVETARKALAFLRGCK